MLFRSSEYVAPQSVEEVWDKVGLTKAFEAELGVNFDVVALLEHDHSIEEVRLRELAVKAADEAYAAKVAEIGSEIMRELEKGLMLRQLDSHWKEHIAALDYLRQGIHLRGYAQRNPKQEYKREAFEMFSSMLDRVKQETIGILSKIQVRRPEDAAAVEPTTPDPSTLRFQHAEPPAFVAPPPEPTPPAGFGQPANAPPLPTPGTESDPVQTYVRDQPKVGRNEPCPCGSGKKFKQCHGRLS